MATSTTLNPTTRVRTDREKNKALYWGLALAIIVVLGIVYATMTSRNRVEPGVTAPAATSENVAPGANTAPVAPADSTMNGGAMMNQSTTENSVGTSAVDSTTNRAANGVVDPVPEAEPRNAPDGAPKGNGSDVR